MLERTTWLGLVDRHSSRRFPAQLAAKTRINPVVRQAAQLGWPIVKEHDWLSGPEESSEVSVSYWGHLTTCSILVSSSAIITPATRQATGKLHLQILRELQTSDWPQNSRYISH